jgi:hypothetical protein
MHDAPKVLAGAPDDLLRIAHVPGHHHLAHVHDDAAPHQTELEGIGDEIGQHLPEAMEVPGHHVSHTAFHRQQQLDALAIRWHHEGGEGRAQQLGEWEGRGLQRHLARFNLLQTQEVIQDLVDVLG